MTTRRAGNVATGPWIMFVMLLAATAARAADADGTNRAAAQPAEPIYIETDVIPILTKLGCNGGGCHGKATGQNGFRLSLFGFEPQVDYESLAVEARGRRIFPAAPQRSLLLQKATAAAPHGGGRRLEEHSDDYRVLSDWIAQGAPPPRVGDPRLVRIELSPRAATLRRGESTTLHATAYFSDGRSRDVTRQAVYQANEPDIVQVDESGRVSATGRPGLAAVMARYGDQMATFEAATPFADAARQPIADAALDALAPQLERSAVDRHLLRNWRRLGIVPSPPADDATFLRRVSLDLCGTLPTPAEVQNYLTDSHPDKRARLIDRLLERPEYASHFALKWAAILQVRGAGYSTSQQRAGTSLFSSWIRDSLESNKPYDQFVTEILTASGSQREQPPTVWYRSVRKSPEYVESVAQAFLGVRIQCAQCHHHPTERWSQDDYFGLAAVFARVGRKGGFADAEVPTDEVIYVKEQGEVRHPRTGERLSPKPLDDAPFSGDAHDDPRRRLAQWMTDESNPYFARTLVNRLWAHFLGRGLVHPIDDARSTNPPTNPELLDELARQFVADGYDVKQLIRRITNCYAYRLDAAPQAGNAGDAQTYSRFYPRRMGAEVLLDALSQVLDVPTNFPGVPAGTRAIDLPDENVAAHFLDVFGRPPRMTACECERTDAPALTQALELVNSVEIQRKLSDKRGAVQRWIDDPRPVDQCVPDVFMRVLGRRPRPDEQQAAERFLATEPDRAEAFRSLVWSLAATNEFLFIH